MPNLTSLAAVAFNASRKKDSANYRVYYQDPDSLLKESCFTHSTGWYVRENCIVAVDAKEETPLAAASWDKGKEIRVYYMSKGGKILERRWSGEGSNKDGVWRPGINPTCTDPDFETQLTVACTAGSDRNPTLRLFYQSSNRQLRQVTWSPLESQWEDAALVSYSDGNFEPIIGSSLAVSSGAVTRVFYLAAPRKLEVIIEQGGYWKKKPLSTLNMSIRKGTPIAVAPHMELGEPDEPDERAMVSKRDIFFIDDYGKLLHKLYDIMTEDLVSEILENTDDDSSDSGEEVEEGGAIAVASSSEENASVFYQSSNNRISEYDVKGRFEVFLGIPTSVGGDPGAYNNLNSALGGLKLDDHTKLGLVDRHIIDTMDATTKKIFIQRLTTDATVVLSTASGWDDIKSSLENLSKDFGLGVRWQGGQNTTWNGWNAAQWAAEYQNTDLPLQARLAAQKASIILGSGYTVQQINVYWMAAYIETLEQLLQYLGIGK